jgi:hypothetical protein
MTITFLDQINVSVAIGDLAWYVTPSTAGVPGNEYSVASASSALLIGEITDVTPYSITVDVVVNTPLSTSYILFSKNNEINKSNLIGYYAKVTMVNSSKQKVELMSVGSRITESSK